MGLALITPDVDFSGNNIGKVTLTGEVKIRSLSIVSPSQVIGRTETLRVSFYPVNTNQRGVIWSIESGREYASINSNGVLTINPLASSSNVVVKVASTINPNITATKTIVCTYDSGSVPTPLYYLDKEFNGTEYIEMERSIMDGSDWCLTINYSLPSIPTAESRVLIANGSSNENYKGLFIGGVNNTYVFSYNDGIAKKNIELGKSAKIAIRQKNSKIYYNTGSGWVFAMDSVIVSSRNTFFGGFHNYADDKSAQFVPNGSTIKATLWSDPDTDVSSFFA